MIHSERFCLFLLMFLEMSTASNNGQRSMERVAAMCANVSFNRILSAANYAASSSIFQPATIATMELTSAQTLLLTLLYSLVTGDIVSCCMMAGICSRLQQLRSTHLKVWLKEDFEFDRQDMKKALTLLSELLTSGTLHLPLHVVNVLSSLAGKYRVTGLQFPSASQVCTIYSLYSLCIVSRYAISLLKPNIVHKVSTIIIYISLFKFTLFTGESGLQSC